MAPSSPETTPYFSILSPPPDPLLMSIRSAPSSLATPSRTSRPRRARGCRGGLGGALGERPRSAVLLLLLTSASGAPVSGSDSAARQEAIDSLVARSSLVELQISGSRTGLVYRVGVEGCLPLRQSGPPRTLYLVAWSLGHTILPSRIQLHPPIGREQFTGAAPLMRSMALAADAGAWRDGISATQKTGKVFRYADHLLDEAAWRTFPHAAKLLARWVDGAVEPLPAGARQPDRRSPPGVQGPRAAAQHGQDRD